MKQAIRIENESGLGVFTDMWTFGMRCYHSVMSRHQTFNTPQQDIGIEDRFIEGVHHCAYKSVEQLQSWILPDELREIMSHGFNVYLLNLSDWIEGQDQIVFERDHIISKEDISSLFV
jgi:hypothetical protein